MRIHASVNAQEKGQRKAGFKEVGDLMCSQFESIAFHGYARGDVTAFAWSRVGYPAVVICEILSLFGNGVALVTSQNANINDEEAAGSILRQGFPGTATEGLVAHHDERVSELAASRGAPVPGTASQKRFAEALGRVIFHLLGAGMTSR